MSENSVPDPNRLGKLCLESFESIPKTGKPIFNTEWTVMSCIAKLQHDTNQIDVVAIGTGTKCMGKCSLSRTGESLNDSHAEVMCRRGFLRYLYEQINHAMAAAADDVSIFTFNRTTKKFQVDKNISFHFFTTHSPCGDGSIFTTSSHDQTSAEPVAKMPKLESHPQNVESIGDRVSFTGAKILYKSTDVAQDLMVQSIGEVRTKPGRGEPNCSASCSDKFAKWSVLGMQGALIYTLVEEPIYFTSITLCDSKYCDVASTERALWKRFEKCELNLSSFASFTVRKPIVQMCQDIKFWFEKNDSRQPAAGSIVWCKTTKYSHQVAVNGKRLGITKKNEKTRGGRLLISKIELFRCYLDILKIYNQHLCLIPNEMNLEVLQYDEAKANATNYQKLWTNMKENYFHIWPMKPNDLNKFAID